MCRIKTESLITNHCRIRHYFPDDLSKVTRLVVVTSQDERRVLAPWGLFSLSIVVVLLVLLMPLAGASYHTLRAARRMQQLQDELEKLAHTDFLTEAEYRRVFGDDTQHPFTGIDYVNLYKELAAPGQVEVYLANDPRAAQNRRITITVLTQEAEERLLGKQAPSAQQDNKLQSEKQENPTPEPQTP